MGIMGDFKKNATVGNATGSSLILGDPSLTAYSAYRGGGNVMGGLEGIGDNLGIGTNRREQAGKRAAADAADKKRQADEDLYNQVSQENKAYEDTAGQNASKYQAGRNALTTDYSKSYANASAEARKYQSQAEDQAKNAQTNYSNVLAPNMQSYLDRAGSEARGAMSLSEAGDINNKYIQDTTKLYDQRAANEGRRGLADTGVLQSLGAQATATQLGGAGLPMTGGQLIALQGANQSQAGQAYANVQKRMAALRDQGLETGMKRSDMQYERGQGAVDRYGKGINQASDLGINQNRLMSGLRGEASGYGENASSADLAGLGRRQSDLSEDFDLDKYLSEMGHGNFEKRTALQQGNKDAYNSLLQNQASRDIMLGSSREAAARQMIGSGAIAGGKAAITGGAGVPPS